MTEFILNNTVIQTGRPRGMALLDFIRYQQQLTGTKIGCREGDCGACTILVGELSGDTVVYRSATSCLMALGNAHGKHIVTIEGINGPALNPFQESFAKEGASQCGFCTPGFMVSLTGYALQSGSKSFQGAIDAVGGNICRCTGYKSIERAIEQSIADLPSGAEPLQKAIDQQFVPAWFASIPNLLKQLHQSILKHQRPVGSAKKKLGGGTDLYVQQHDQMLHSEIDFLFDQAHLNGIHQEGNTCIIKAAATVTDLQESAIIQQHFPEMNRLIRLVSSTPIRNMATLAGNLANASPIGDFTIFFLALNADVELSDGNSSRIVPLQQFYKGYKLMDKTAEEHIESIRFALPDAATNVNFEKVCKRTHLDIASVNSAMVLRHGAGNQIEQLQLSAGGIAAIPTAFPEITKDYIGEAADAQVASDLIRRVMDAVSPISDVRGTAIYKRRLLAQLIKAHLLHCFPEPEAMSATLVKI